MANKKADLSDAERKSLVEGIFITSPRFTRVKEMIRRCHQHSKIAAEPECLLIRGWQGTGKTTLCQDYVRAFPRYTTDSGVVVPVLATSIPVPATIKGLSTQLLWDLGDPRAEKGTKITQTIRLLEFAKECEVELVILDEFQHFIDRDSNTILDTTADWLKHCINISGKPFILMGMPYCDLILKANAQLERRFTMRVSLEPFGWETEAEQDEFRTFLRHLDEKLPFPVRSNLCLDETAFRLYCATNGYVGYLMKLVRGAAHLAIDRSFDRLDLELLAEAYDERLAARVSSRPNPFIEDIEKLEAQPFDEWAAWQGKLKRLLE